MIMATGTTTEIQTIGMPSVSVFPVSANGIN
jgi:hypothetical protein